MGFSLSFVQFFFTLVCILFSTSLATHYLEGGVQWLNIAVGVLGGCVMSVLLFGLDLVLKRFNLRSFNVVLLGLFLGYLMSQAILLSLDSVIGSDIHQDFVPFRFLIVLGCSYMGVSLIQHASDEFRISIPFVELKLTGHKKKDILVDVSIFTDARIIDLASTGLLDHHLIIPRFAVKDLYAQSESGDESIKSKARRSLEIIKKLESLPSLDLRYVDTDFPEIKDAMARLIRLARFLDTHIITSDMNRIQQSSYEGVRIINIHMLSNALKPITQAGESISIKIQRYGKEARQGVGYLDDGTMVVVNGGAEFIGETIKAYVLSVKHTSSGRMIFCNAAEEGSLLTDNEFMSKDFSKEYSKDFISKDYASNVSNPQEFDSQKNFLAL